MTDDPDPWHLPADASPELVAFRDLCRANPDAWTAPQATLAGLQEKFAAYADREEARFQEAVSVARSAVALADELMIERDAALARIAALEAEGDRAREEKWRPVMRDIAAYAQWTVEERGRHHPALPDAIAAAVACLGPAPFPVSDDAARVEEAAPVEPTEPRNGETWWTDEPMPRAVLRLGASAIDPDVWVGQLEGQEEAVWVICHNGLLLNGKYGDPPGPRVTVRPLAAPPAPETEDTP